MMLWIAQIVGIAAVVLYLLSFQLKNRGQIIDDMAHYLDKLAADETLRKQLAIGSLKRSRDFTWESKLKILNEVYSNATTH